MIRRTRIGCAAAFVPNTVTVPDSGLSSVVSIRIVVVLPAPLGPSNPNVSPTPIRRSTWSTAVRAPKR